jgi:hypothetical protein
VGQSVSQSVNQSGRPTVDLVRKVAGVVVQPLSQGKVDGESAQPALNSLDVDPTGQRNARGRDGGVVQHFGARPCLLDRVAGQGRGSETGGPRLSG